MQFLCPEENRRVDANRQSRPLWYDWAFGPLSSIPPLADCQSVIEGFKSTFSGPAGPRSHAGTVDVLLSAVLSVTLCGRFRFQRNTLRWKKTRFLQNFVEARAPDTGNPSRFEKVVST